MPVHSRPSPLHPLTYMVPVHSPQSTTPTPPSHLHGASHSRPSPLHPLTWCQPQSIQPTPPSHLHGASHSPQSIQPTPPSHLHGASPQSTVDPAHSTLSLTWCQSTVHSRPSPLHPLTYMVQLLILQATLYTNSSVTFHREHSFI